jgi:uncharacterized membrane protein
MKSLIILLFLLSTGTAQALTNPAPDLFLNFSSNDLESVVFDIIKFLLGIVGILSMFYLVWGGFQFMFAGLNKTMAEQGAKTIRNALTGLIIAILSYIIITVVINTLEKF